VPLLNVSTTGLLLQEAPQGGKDVVVELLQQTPPRR
jgi:hypothetical protein